MNHDSPASPATAIDIHPVRLRGAANQAVRFPLLVVRRIPFSVVMIGLILGLAWATGSIHGDLAHGTAERWGYDLDNLRAGRIWVVVSSEVLTSYPAHVQNTTLMLLLWLVPYEALAGTARALVAYWGSTLLGTGIAALISLLLIRTVGFDQSPDLVHGADVGASVGAWGVAGALSVALAFRGPVGRVAGLVFPVAGMSYLVYVLVQHRGVSDIAHPIGLITGIGVGLALTRRPDRRSGRHGVTTALPRQEVGR